MTCSFLLSLLLTTAPVEADVVLRGGDIHLGDGKAALKGDVALKGDRIVAIGEFEVKGNPRILDCKGYLIAPGFIDLHSHSDNPLLAAATRSNANFLTQGVTTVVTGNCGAGPVDVAAYYGKLDRKVGTNVAHQIPHNNLRRAVMGEDNRKPTAAELTKMKALVEKGMKEGAWGLATGLYYTPGSFADTEELIELSKVVASHGGFYASHMRDEGAGLLTSIDETLTIGRKGGVPVHISHIKSYGRNVWGKAPDALGMIEAARKKGQRVTADQYPYTASSTSLAADVIPTRYREGKLKDFLDRLNDKELGPKVRQAMEQNIKGCDDGKSIRIARYIKNPKWQGKSLAAIAESEGKTPLELALEIERNGGAQIVNFSMSEDDMRQFMRQPFVATASDGQAMTNDGTMIHPRNYGTFARKIGRFAIEEKIVPVEAAIRSATGLPADILGMSDRGYLKEGYMADVVVLDPMTFRDMATFDKPHTISTGVVALYVNGVLAVEKGKPTTALAGRALHHPIKAP